MLYRATLAVLLAWFSLGLAQEGSYFCKILLQNATVTQKVVDCNDVLPKRIDDAAIFCKDEVAKNKSWVDVVRLQCTDTGFAILYAQCQLARLNATGGPMTDAEQRVMLSYKVCQLTEFLKYTDKITSSVGA